MSNDKTIKVRFATYVSDGCDGSVYIYTFANRELAENFAKRDDRRFEGDVNSHELEFDLGGNLIFEEENEE